ncbi:MAG: hypothetical protein CM1200mP13_07730 [Candidatus Pelagibacterales bacterium]|nr:MAG: hypothetical protein CM1200mP13_07730 [Pelagibacterales bacterium]
MDATTVLSRQIAEIGIYPAVDPLDSTSRILDPRIVGDEHYRVARDVQRILQSYKSLQDIKAILGMDELSEEDKLVVARAEKSRDFYLNHSSLQKYLLVLQENLLILTQRSKVLMQSVKVSMIIYLKLPFIWLVQLKKL